MLRGMAQAKINLHSAAEYARNGEAVGQQRKQAKNKHATRWAHSHKLDAGQWA